MIPFNKPFLTGKETEYIVEAVNSGHISGNGVFTKRCHKFFTEKYNFHKVLLTTSCTDALEMCALLLDIQPGDEVIVPSYTFVSSALAFVRQGAKIIFTDSLSNHPNMDVDKVENLITEKTKAIVPVHYASMAVEMDKLMKIANKYGIYVVEDAAQAINTFYKDKPLGGIGHLGAYSFHETKNIISGEGGMLIINDKSMADRAEVLWEKGTNRASFFRGEVNKYGWVDTGSSFLPSEITAAFLYAQLEKMDMIQRNRVSIWNLYNDGLSELEKQGKIKLPIVPEHSTNNGHMFYIICKSLNERTKLISFLKERNILSVFHYLSLHKSEFYSKSNVVPELSMSDYYTDHLLRLPFYFELTDDEVIKVIETVIEFYNNIK
ncbi:dTDP-4-amino-4,6-dideoxygalactose transaminase [Aureibaculum conchae]|uniref:dTDP-4-amino-4,6-dideoxygalactose transaminase n=1 Tax=Aureibaculum sp. 2308TA14-22 TaxID=3108392 RepID=UPI0033991CD7